MNSERGFWRSDLSRYPRGSILTQPGLWAILVYRFGRWTYVCPRIVRKPMHATYFIAYSVTRLLTGIDIPRSVMVGPGLMIHHFGGIILNPRTEIGEGCTLRHGVTIGNRLSDDDVPVIGNGVQIGAYAQILGRVVVGDKSTVGALSLVLSDVPNGATVVGAPARVIKGLHP